MRKNLFLVAVLCSGMMFACAPKQEREEREAVDMSGWSDSAKIAHYYQQISGEQDFEKYKEVVLICEGMRCPSLDRNFASEQLCKIDDSTTLFIITSIGSVIDISAYVDTPRKNVLWDTLGIFKRMRVRDTCDIIPLR